MIYKLDKIDRIIIYELDQNARIPETRLAKLCNRSKESVRYRIKQLEKNKIITRYFTWIDPTKLGYHTFKMYMRLGNTPDERKKLYEYIKNEKSVFWLGIGDGVWNAGITFFAKSNSEFYRLKQNIFSRFKNLILKNTTGSIVDAKVYSKTFLIEKSRNIYPLFGDVISSDIDELDRKLLQLLFQNSRMTLVKLANLLKVSSDTIRNRMKKLEKAGIIMQYKTAIDFNKLGYEFFKTFVYFRNITAEEEKRFIAFIEQEPNVIHFLKTISPWDMELEVMVPSYLEYNQLINKIEENFPNIVIDIETTIISRDYIYPSEKIVFD